MGNPTFEVLMVVPHTKSEMEDESIRTRIVTQVVYYYILS